jgi:Uri superfamily endonuclease
MTPAAIPSDPGTYALVLACSKTGALRIGKLGTLVLQPGFCLYVGSAFGPGGLAARIRHHTQIAARPHWHVDYLRAACDLIEVWYTTATKRQEHSWAMALARLPGSEVPMQGFGSSDCRCEAHLFWFQKPPSDRAFRQRVRALVSTTRPPSERRSGYPSNILLKWTVSTSP